MKKILPGLLACALVYACANDINMFLPRGPEGHWGTSAYDVWVEAVKSGIIDWSEATDMSGFFRYLKGKDGADGIAGHDGIDGMGGVDGMGTYELWLEMVEDGVADPHNPGRQWDKGKTSISDFFWFLSGNDGIDGINGSNGNDGPAGSSGTSGTSGLSAYEIWVKDVLDENGLVNHHDPAGGLWPRDKVSLSDFWEYLHGEDGGSSEIYVPVQTPGSAGTEVTPVLGKANVFSDFSDREHSEYVSTIDGSVTFHVLDDAGKPAANAKVKGLPGMNPAFEFTADAKGEFKVLKEKLPTTGTNEQRYGATAEVEYTNSQGVLKIEASAPNTYVPQKIDIRIRVCGNIITSNYVENDHIEGAVAMGVPIVTERRVTDTSDWEVIPGYLKFLQQTFKVYELGDHEDPASYTTSNDVYWNSLSSPSSTLNLASSLKRVERPTKAWPAMKTAVQKRDYRLWEDSDGDGKEDAVYVNIVLESYYGESPHADAVIEVAPVQFHPLPTITTSKYTATGNGLDGISGTFEFPTGYEELLYDTNLAFMDKITADGKAYTYYYPVITTPRNTINNVKSFSLVFRKAVTGGEDVSTTTPVTLGNPQYTLGKAVLDGSYLYLKPSGRFYVGPGVKEPVGILQGNSTDGFYIKAVDTKFTFNDIPVTYAP